MATETSNRLLPTKFRDQAGREWTIRFNGNSMREIKEELGANICEAMTDSQRFFTQTVNTELAMGMTWIAVRRQAAERKVGAEEFLEEIYGQALIDLTDAFWGALLNFSQGEKTLAAAGRLLAKTRALAEKKMALLDLEIDAVTEDQIETLLRENLGSPQTKPTTTSGSAPESSESTPAT